MREAASTSKSKKAKSIDFRHVCSAIHPIFTIAASVVGHLVEPSSSIFCSRPSLIIGDIQ